MKSTLSIAAGAMRGTLHGNDRDFRGVSTDSRTISAGELFFALTGPNFDGSKFVSQASDKGAAGSVVVSRVDSELPQIQVDDTRLALGRLGARWRQMQTARVVGVTGSNGKTTLKEMIRACLSQTAATIATKGNLNNEIGMPLMLLQIEASDEYAVIEMGANHRGEIAYLTSLAKPDVVVISNAGPSHLEGFGSLQGVAEGKGEILQGEPRPACAILNADDDYFDFWSELAADIEVLSFGLAAGADIHASAIRPGRDETRFCLHLPATEIDVRLPLAGQHNVRNACAAAAVAVALGVPAETIRAGLESTRAVTGRLQPVAGIRGAALYDDSYNANPASVIAASEFLASLDGRNWMVLGDMGELGDEAADLHRQLGATLCANGIDRLFAAGELSRNTVKAFGDNAEWFASVEELSAAIAGELNDDVNVLVKGSRSARMERVVDALRAPQKMRREA